MRILFSVNTVQFLSTHTEAHPSLDECESSYHFKIQPILNRNPSRMKLNQSNPKLIKLPRALSCVATLSDFFKSKIVDYCVFQRTTRPPTTRSFLGCWWWWLSDSPESTSSNAVLLWSIPRSRSQLHIAFKSKSGFVSPSVLYSDNKREHTGRSWVLHS